jgi:hypothetical protein
VILMRAGEGPRLCPNSSDSSKVSGSAAQFSMTKALPARGLA